MSEMTDLNGLRNRVQRFVERFWGPRVYSNRWERSMRVLEEAIELAQASGVTQGIAEELVERVYSRPVGNIGQEYAGVGVCWLAGTATTGLDPGELLEWEIERVENLDLVKVREKHLDKVRNGFAIPGIYNE